jgi:hypothetical protein
MGNWLSEWLHRISTGWVVIVALLVFIAFTALVAPAQAALVASYAGDSRSPDLSLLYSPEQLYRTAEAYGQRGREAYVRSRFTFDLAFPVVYTVFLATALSWLSQRIFAPQSGWQRSNLSPVLAMLCDYGENLSASLVMARYPQPTPLVDWLAPTFTLLKWTFLAASFFLLLMMAAVALRRWAGSRG